MRGKQRHYLAKGNQKIRCFVVADFIVVVVFVAKFSFLSERAKSDLGIQFPSFTHREVVFVAAFLPSLVYLCMCSGTVNIFSVGSLKGTRLPS